MKENIIPSENQAVTAKEDSVTQVATENATKVIFNQALQLKENAFNTHCASALSKQGKEDFFGFMRVDGNSAENGENFIFKNYSFGLATSRDSWAYNSSKESLKKNFETCINFYNNEVDKHIASPEDFEHQYDASKIKWSRTLLAHLEQGQKAEPFNEKFITSSLYRPFVKQYLYNNSYWIDCAYQMPKIFPYEGAKNLVIAVSGLVARSFSCFMSSCISDIHLLEGGAKFFPRYIYTKKENFNHQDNQDIEIDEQGYVKEDAITQEAIAHFKQAYPGFEDKIDADAIFYYIYGILSSKDYRENYADNLMKDLPRIPRVSTYEDFAKFEQAGRALAELHINYEKVEAYSGCNITGLDKANTNYRVIKMKYGKIEGKKGNAAKDKSVIIYNDDITISNIPLEAQNYIVNAKSPLDLVVDRCGIKIDHDSKIENDYNKFAQEQGDEKYILNLILKLITVSLKTVEIVDSLPKLSIHNLDTPK